MEPIFPAEESSMQQQMQEMSFSFDPEEATLETEPVAADSEESSTESVVFARLESDVNSVAFSPDGRKIVAGLGNGTLQLFDAISGKPIGAPFRGHNYNVWSVAFSPTSPAFPEEISEVIASGGEDKTLRLWDLQGNQIGEPFQGHEFGVLSVAFSPDSKVLVSGSGDQTLRLWDLQGNQIGQPFQGHEDWVRSVAFSPDGSLIVSGSDDQTLRLWDLQGNQIGLPFQGHESRVWSVAFSPDGKFIVSGSDDQTVRLWDLQGNQIGQSFQGHESWVLSVAFSPDGRFIVSGSADQTLRFWDLQGNQIRQPFQGHGSYVWSVAFSPDGKAIVSGGSDRTLRLWDLQGNSIASCRQIIEVPQGITNDAAEGEDQLNIRDEIEAMATVLMLRSLQPPVAVAILGSWGSGKSFGMHLMRQRVKEIREQKLTSLKAWGDPDLPNNTEILSPYVGHVYQISFNAWTYAKSDLWASLMQEIFYELNRQITLERQIGTFLRASSAPEENKIEQPESNSAEEVSSIRNIDRLIYKPFQNLKETIQKNIKTRTVSLKKKLTIFAQEILNLWLVQLVLHIVIFLITILENIFYYLFVVPLDRITKERFDLISKFNTILFVYFIREQFEAYYFPPDLQTSYKSWRKGIESVIEHLLFLLFIGFSKRLKDSKENLKNFKERQNPKPALTADHDIEAIRQEAFEKVLLDKGDFWEVLYLSSDEERRAFIEKHDRLKKFKDWKDPTSNSNYLWNTLDQNKQKEQQNLKEQEQKLQEKEQELQRKLKAAEAEVNRQIANRKATALYQPIVKAIAQLLLSKEDMEKLAEAGQTTDETLSLIKKVVTSWQGLTALFVMTFVIILSLDSVTRAVIFTAIQNLLEQTGLTALIDRLIPITVKNNLTAFANLIHDWFTNLPQWFEWIRTQIPSGIQLITGVVAVGASLIPILKTLNNYLTSVQKEQAKIQSDREFLLKQKQDKAENLVKEVAQLKLQVAEQRQRVGLTANYASLMDFVSDRLQVDDYGKRLGLMQQVKQDLADLSDRLTDWQHNRDELKKFFPRGPARVVLYIDDLDRCPPNRVVEVLESVQLL
ncbi:MAG: P-loop NTPase fold protein, partial [Pseudanabaenaceae cyanobacterium]